MTYSRIFIMAAYNLICCIIRPLREERTKLKYFDARIEPEKREITLFQISDRWVKCKCRARSRDVVVTRKHSFAATSILDINVASK